MMITELRVHMDCTGCEAKIKKALQKLDGVDDITIDLAMKKVTVLGWVDPKKVLKTVRKTGKKAEFWPYPYSPEYHGYTYRYCRYEHYQVPASSYNYNKHGYHGHDHGYFPQSPFSTIIDDEAKTKFSDDNPHACSIM